MNNTIYIPSPLLQGIGRIARSLPGLKRWWASFLKWRSGRTWPVGGRVVLTSRGLLRLDWRNYVDRQIAFYGDFEEAQLTYFLGEMARRGCGVFLDIGANIGLYSIAAQLQGKPKRTIAFEPDARNLERLKENLSLNGIGGVEVLDKAVSASSGTITFLPAGGTVTGKSRVGEGEGQVTLEAVALDDLFDFQGQSIFIKIDIEEHELEAIQGMRRLLGENRVFLQVECFAHNLAALTKELAALGLKQVHAIGEDRYFTNDAAAQG